jgi:hypothetical protein
MFRALMSGVTGYLPLALGCCFALLAVWKLLKKPIANYSTKYEQERNRGMVERLKSIINVGTPSTPSDANSTWTDEREADNISKQIEIVNKINNPHRGFARVWAVLSVLIIALSWAGWAWLAVKDHHKISVLENELSKYRTETVTEHNVTILGRLEDGDFAFRSDEEPGGGAFRPCPADIVNGLDVIGMLNEGIGYTAEHASWEERGVCKSILRADLGFWWRSRNTNFRYMEATR